MNGLLRRWISSVAAQRILVFAFVLVAVFSSVGAGAPAQLADAGTQEEALVRVDELSALFRDVALELKPAVVEVRVIKWVRQLSLDDFLEHFFGQDSPFGLRRERLGRRAPPRRPRN